jgi:hypothetical protein
MDQTLEIIVLLVLSAISIIFVYFTSKSTMDTCKARIDKAVKNATQEASKQNDGHVLYGAWMERSYVGATVFGSAFFCLMSFFLYFADPPYFTGVDRFLQTAIAIPIFGIGLVSIYNIALRLYHTSLFIVSEDGIDHRKFNDSGQRSVQFIKWNEVVKVSVGSSRQSADHVQVTIESEHGDINPWAWWSNFEFLAEKMLRLSPNAHFGWNAKSVLEWKAEKVKSHPTTIPVYPASNNEGVRPRKSLRWLLRLLRRRAITIGCLVFLAIMLLMAH